MTANNKAKNLAVCALRNEINSDIIIRYQKSLTAVSESKDLEYISIVIPKGADNRGLRAGTYKLVDILKTLGCGLSDEKNDIIEEVDCHPDVFDCSEDFLSDPMVMTEGIIQRLIADEDTDRAAIRIESDRKSCFVSGYYLLKPLLQILRESITEFNIKESMGDSEYKEFCYRREEHRKENS